jgi:hypothetical protein
MQKHLKMKNGETIEDAIVIDTPNSIQGVIKEHEPIDRICGTKDTDVKLVEQNLIKENQKVYDKFAIKIMNGTEKVM